VVYQCKDSALLYRYISYQVLAIILGLTDIGKISISATNKNILVQL